MAKEITYRENLIILNSPDDVQAFILNEDGEIEDNTFGSLEEAKKWIDNNKRQDTINRHGKVHLEYNCQRTSPSYELGSGLRNSSM